jgi:DNA (cytosine-5)-methyltransferase 1
MMRDLFPDALRLIGECRPKAVMLENVRGLFDPKFSNYRNHIKSQIEAMGYLCFWELVNAAYYGVSQQRPRTILIALNHEFADYFSWPQGVDSPPLTVGQLLYSEMASNGWKGAKNWSEHANGVAPTLVESIV